MYDSQSPKPFCHNKETNVWKSVHPSLTAMLVSYLQFFMSAIQHISDVPFRNLAALIFLHFLHNI